MLRSAFRRCAADPGPIALALRSRPCVGPGSASRHFMPRRVRDTRTPSSFRVRSLHSGGMTRWARRSPDAAQRDSGALLIRGPCLTRRGSRLCGATSRTLRRVRDTREGLGLLVARG